ncbi:MAG TPA: NfeD family protein [Microvirga sp.]|jgi:membrane protein implicated in regulation of membrane protease activity
MLGSWIEALGAWTWVLIGIACFAAELFAPGILFVWLGIAALLTAAIDGLVGLSWQAAMLTFGALSVVSVLVGRRLLRTPFGGGGDGLNRRGEALVGREFTLDAPIVRGEGRVRVDDSSWRIEGADAPVGARVRVLRVDGSTLVVERA